MRKLLLFVMTTGLILTGCGEDSSGPSPAPDYFPITIGNQWDYVVDGYIYETGQDTVYATGTLLREATRSVTHDNGTPMIEMVSIAFFSAQSPDTTVAYTDTSYTYAFDADSELIGYEDTLSADYEIIMKFPATLGETWEPMTYYPTMVREVVSLNYSVSVPAGNYSNCIHLQDTDTDDPGYESNMYFAEDVGPVLFVTEEASPTTSSVIHLEIELESYILN